MSKWISGFPPSRSGSYLVKSIRKGASYFETFNKSNYYLLRLDYRPEERIWINRDKHLIYRDNHIMLNSILDFYWWDEYGITENKKKIKLKF